MAALHTIGELSPGILALAEGHPLLRGPGPALPGTGRDAAGLYAKRDRARLKLILRGKRLGFSLADIREFLDLYDADRSKRRQMAMTLQRTRSRIAALEQQLADITLTLAELRDMEAEVAAYVDMPPESAAEQHRSVA